MTTVRIPTPLRAFTGGAKEVDASGENVGELLKDLARRFPDLWRHLFDEAGTVRPYVNVFVNEEDVQSLQGDATPIGPGDRVMIIPSIAGGACAARGPVDAPASAALG